MKYILIILFLVPILSYGQADSSRVTVSNVVVKAKDLWFVYSTLVKKNRNEDLDSTIKAKARPTTPNDNNDVTINNIERRVWREVYQTLTTDVIAYSGGVQKRVHDALLLINDVWLNDKIPKDDSSVTDIYDARVSVGKKLAKKEND